MGKKTRAKLAKDVEDARRVDPDVQTWPVLAAKLLERGIRRNLDVMRLHFCSGVRGSDDEVLQVVQAHLVAAYRAGGLASVGKRYSEMCTPPGTKVDALSRALDHWTDDWLSTMYDNDAPLPFLTLDMIRVRSNEFVLEDVEKERRRKGYVSDESSEGEEEEREQSKPKRVLVDDDPAE